jgi:hypothetical protein
MATIRLLQKDDLDSNYKKLLNQSLEVDFEKIFEEILESKIIEVWIVYDDDDDKIIASGTIVFEPKFIYSGNRVARIEDIVVDESKKKLGYDILLMEHLLERAKIKDCCKVIFNCKENNVTIVKEYK